MYDGIYIENAGSIQFKQRGFEVAKGWEDKDINLPARQTKGSAGYDFESAETVTVPSIWKQLSKRLVAKITEIVVPGGTKDDFEFDVDKEKGEIFKPTLVHTGVKAYMPYQEVLLMYNRSSNPIKKALMLGNGVGVVDSDYYENPDNDGEIMFQFINFGITDITIKKGERIGQGIFNYFLLSDNDKPEKTLRKGGHGSTNENN
jgi:dUTP pyrophosphatase